MYACVWCSKHWDFASHLICIYRHTHPKRHGTCQFWLSSASPYILLRRACTFLLLHIIVLFWGIFEGNCINRHKSFFKCWDKIYDMQIIQLNCRFLRMKKEKLHFVFILFMAFELLNWINLLRARDIRCSHVYIVNEIRRQCPRIFSYAAFPPF